VTYFNVEITLSKMFVAADQADLEKAIEAWFKRRSDRDAKLQCMRWRVVASEEIGNK
jgi:hypothetical protein